MTKLSLLLSPLLTSFANVNLRPFGGVLRHLHRKASPRPTFPAETHRIRTRRCHTAGRWVKRLALFRRRGLWSCWLIQGLTHPATWYPDCLWEPSDSDNIERGGILRGNWMRSHYFLRRSQPRVFWACSLKTSASSGLSGLGRVAAISSWWIWLCLVILRTSVVLTYIDWLLQRKPYIVPRLGISW